MFFLREKITDGVIKTCKIKYEKNVADILTKGLSIDEHKKFCSLLHLVDSFQGSPGLNLPISGTCGKQLL
ncbi:hypothetical protein Tco_0635038 [Tanacetum coccineum]